MGGRLPQSAREMLVAGGLLAPPRARSLRRLCGQALACLREDAGVDELDALARSWAESPEPQDDADAMRRLMAIDLRAILDAMSARTDPAGDLDGVLDALVAALGAEGLRVERPRLHLAAGLPPLYDVPFLRAVSIDASDAAHAGLAAGIHVDASRVAPGVTACVLGHVLVHSALGHRSPERLGRGLEEGLCEILGALHAAAAVIGADTADAAFDALRRTPGPGPHREAFLGHVRAATLLHARHGLAGLVALVNEGREAIARAEHALLGGRPEEVDLPRAAPDEALAARLDRLLSARGAPLLVRPLAFYMLPALRRERDVVRAADALGVPRPAALEACRELVDRAFVLLLSDRGEVLVDDLDAVLPEGLRYDVPVIGGSVVP